MCNCKSVKAQLNKQPVLQVSGLLLACFHEGECYQDSLPRKPSFGGPRSRTTVWQFSEPLSGPTFYGGAPEDALRRLTSVSPWEGGPQVAYSGYGRYSVLGSSSLFCPNCGPLLLPFGSPSFGYLSIFVSCQTPQPGVNSSNAKSLGFRPVEYYFGLEPRLRVGRCDHP